MPRAGRRGASLDEKSAAIVKGMLERGDRHHDVAAWFGVNGGRIAEISKGYRFPEVEPATTDLPPQGPYVSGQIAKNTMERLKDIKISLNSALEEVEKAIAQLEEEINDSND